MKKASVEFFMNSYSSREFPMMFIWLAPVQCKAQDETQSFFFYIDQSSECGGGGDECYDDLFATCFL